MIRNKQAGKARLMTAASILTLALVALPFEPNLDGVAVDGTAAHAKGNGGGHGGGNSGHGGADTASGADSAAGSGRGHGKAGAPGQNKDGASGIAAAGDIGEEDVAKNHGATVSIMGGLNSWANTSATARARKFQLAGRPGCHLRELPTGRRHWNRHREPPRGGEQAGER